MKERLLGAAKRTGISAAGFCRAEIFDELSGILSKNPVSMASGNARERINPFLLMPEAKSIMVCLFSYNCGGGDTNLSRYARGADYHAVVRSKLSVLEDILSEHDFLSKSFCDTGPLCDRYLAYRAGLGFFGRSRALINPEYGSYTFIGYILTDAQIEPDKPILRTCMQCGRCEAACPGGAISADGFSEEKCASFLTQKKGALSGDERSIIKKSGSAWGCDICQKVCPHNLHAKQTDLYEFSTDLINELSPGMAESERGFRRKYRGRAFSWRGYGVILRNLDILQEE